ncbi:MAG TPA: hypothetical protein K8V15_11865 [Tessaracoccus flavescens]|uniref:Uncharacterized protein n=1 Tax=Tessaracoccus flavescens TaxID=399497 RepID=A0A921ERW1_9ACTN|nr:hypothetical protein [Tessaracoccus flavescens]
MSTVAARQAVATACVGVDSIRADGGLKPVPPLPSKLVEYFDGWQV